MFLLALKKTGQSWRAKKLGQTNQILLIVKGHHSFTLDG
jgi:hypothetical protein